MGDAQSIFDAIDRDRARLANFLPWPPAIKIVQDEADYIAYTHELWEQHRFFDYSLFYKPAGAFIGSVGVMNINWPNAAAELGYWIIGDYEGRGLVSEAVSAIAAYLFDSDFFRIEVRCTEGNLRSCQVAERLGFVREGVLRGNIMEHGLRRNTIVYSKLAVDPVRI
jgi:RimJ/RimL family protein N-acetyltransferase